MEVEDDLGLPHEAELVASHALHGIGIRLDVADARPQLFHSFPQPGHFQPCGFALCFESVETSQARGREQHGGHRHDREPEQEQR